MNTGNQNILKLCKSLCFIGVSLKRVFKVGVIARNVLRSLRGKKKKLRDLAERKKVHYETLQK